MHGHSVAFLHRYYDTCKHVLRKLKVDYTYAYTYVTCGVNLLYNCVLKKIFKNTMHVVYTVRVTFLCTITCTATPIQKIREAFQKFSKTFRNKTFLIGGPKSLPTNLFEQFM